MYNIFVFQRHAAHWNNWLKKYYNDCIEIEDMCKENKEKMFIKMNAFDKEVSIYKVF